MMFINFVHQKHVLRPALKRIDVADGTVWIANDQGAVAARGVDRRTAEREFVRLLLCNILQDEVVEVAYQPAGQPCLPKFPHLYISISHSAHWYAIYISEAKPVGVDIQVPRQAILKGVDYFLNEVERQDKQRMADLDSLHKMWGAKEAFYKLLGGAEQEPEKAFTIREIEQASSGRIMLAYAGKQYVLHAEKHEEYYLVYTL